uniref:Defensin, beta-like 2 n=1 Tax=Cynoglossus semilaevis TaxID=244447 RepID=A0A3P8WXT4_CYNSE
MMDRHGTECCCSAQRTRTWLFFFALLRTRRRNHIFQLSPLCGHFQSKYRSRDAFYWFAVTRLIFRQEIERINGTNIERVAGADPETQFWTCGYKGLCRRFCYAQEYSVGHHGCPRKYRCCAIRS